MDTAPNDHGQTTGAYVLTGLDAIAAQFHRHPSTIRRWIRNEGLLVCRLPNGEHATSFGLIDKWLLNRAAETEER